MKPIIPAIALLAALFAVPAMAATERIVLPADVTPARYDIAIVPDAGHLTFAGSVGIAIDVHRPTAQIALNAAELAFRRVALSGVAATPKVSFDAAQETATLTFPAPVAAGRHILAIDYTGKINRNAAGLFALDYDAVGGKARALFTQFENSDARRFVPCWDEPARKAVFVLTATVPAGEMAVSNLPIAASEMLAGGLKRVRFAPSPRMSSYLLFFGLGDFQRISRKVNGIDVGVIVKRGDAAKAAYALDTAAQILPYYEDYFATKYPLPKLDLIAGPGESQFFGAMENWGAIFYFERDLLIDPKISTAADRRDVYITIAHEVAHQWFGDLVTMAWWDGIWLNEGFASWMELKAADRFHPEWNVWLDALSSREAAMRVDARAGTHPIIQPIRDVLQANEAFDTITYSKGQAVIRMLESYLGADIFRAGVRRYIKAHAYGNTVSDDLWRELDKTSSTPVTTIAHDFTLQAGVPLIRANASGQTLGLTQDRYAEDDSGKAPASWHVPVVEASVGAQGVWRGIVSRQTPADIALVPGALAIVNRGQAGYFRTLYDPSAFAALASRFHGLSPADQIGLLNDSSALGLAAYVSAADILVLASRATADMDPDVIETVATRLQALDRLYDGLPGQPAFRVFARRVLDPVLARVGWSARNGEGPNVPLLREALLGTLGELDDAAVVAEARGKFATFLKSPAALSADDRQSVLAIVAENADPAAWDALRGLAATATASLEARQYFVLLGRARDPALAERALQFALSGDVPVTTRPSILAAVAKLHPQMALEFLAAHFGEFDPIIEPDSRVEFAPALASTSHDPAIIMELRAYADAHIPPDARGDEVKAEAAIAFNASVRRNRLPELDRWLAAH
jgi:aminopeptidase N